MKFNAAKMKQIRRWRIEILAVEGSGPPKIMNLVVSLLSWGVIGLHVVGLLLWDMRDLLPWGMGGLLPWGMVGLLSWNVISLLLWGMGGMVGLLPWGMRGLLPWDMGGLLSWGMGGLLLCDVVSLLLWGTYDRPTAMMCGGRRIFNSACMMLLFIKRKEFRHHGRNHEFGWFQIFNSQHLNAPRTDLFHFWSIEFRLIYCVIQAISCYIILLNWDVCSRHSTA